MREVKLTDEQKQEAIRGIHRGKSEAEIIQRLGVERMDFYYAVAADSDFRSELQQAKTHRADVWFDKVIQDADVVPDKSEVAGEKLRFEKLKFLAEMDNPEKYSPKHQIKHEGGLSILDFKELTLDQARQILSDDPFAIPAEFEVVEDEEGEVEGLELL